MAFRLSKQFSDHFTFFTTSKKWSNKRNFQKSREIGLGLSPFATIKNSFVPVFENIGRFMIGWTQGLLGPIQPPHDRSIIIVPKGDL
jgi:hypothetical protein